MDDELELLAALQHADSFFPSGAASFSWGLESLAADGHVASAADLASFVAGQLTWRWGACDRPALAAAHRAGADLEAVAAIDRLLETLTLPREMREGSRRNGLALLDMHARLGTAPAASYRAAIRAGSACGHLPVVQGLLWRAIGVSEESACAMSAHALCTGYVAAAMRLGIAGHIEAQRIILEMRPRILALLAEPPVAVERISMYAPLTDVASMRHEAGAVRLFAN